MMLSVKARSRYQISIPNITSAGAMQRLSQAFVDDFRQIL